MTIEQLIEELQRLKEKLGNVEVVAEYRPGLFVKTIDNIDYDIFNTAKPSYVVLELGKEL